MKIMDVVEVLESLSSCLGGDVEDVYLGKGKVKVMGNYVIADFDCEEVAGIDGYVKLKLGECKKLFNDDVEVRTSEDKEIISFVKSNYEAITKITDVSDVSITREGKGKLVDVTDIESNGFNIKSLITHDGVASAIDTVVLVDGYCVIRDPMWVVVTSVLYKEAEELSRGVWCFVNEVGNKVRGVKVYENIVEVGFDGGSVFVAKRSGMDIEYARKLLERVGKYYKSELDKVIDGVYWLKDWAGSDDIVLCCSNDGDIVGAEVVKEGRLKIKRDCNGRGKRYMLSKEFIKYLLEAEYGCVVEDTILWLRRGSMDLYVAVRGL